MDRLVYYHHPIAENFSLQFSSASPVDLRERRRDANGRAKIIGYPFESPVYVLYEGTDEVEPASDAEFEQNWIEERLGDLSRAGQVTAFRLIELLEAAVGVRETDKFRLYKEFEPTQVERALENISWGGPLPTVAGELMSNLVLRHALPNANHRTGIAMLQLCIESVEPSFEMPSTYVDDDTRKEWVDPYIVESKRLITVRRNNLRFKRLAELGADVAERKGGIRIRFEDYDLDMHWSEALERYAHRHEQHCTDFAYEVLKHAGRTGLAERAGPTKSEFVQFLDTGVGERDSRELC